MKAILSLKAKNMIFTLIFSVLLKPTAVSLSEKDIFFQVLECKQQKKMSVHLEKWLKYPAMRVKSLFLETIFAAPFVIYVYGIFVCWSGRGRDLKLNIVRVGDEKSSPLLPATQSWLDPETSCSTRLHTDWWLGGTLWKDKTVFASRLSIDEMELFTFHNYYVHKPYSDFPTDLSSPSWNHFSCWRWNNVNI